MPYTPEQLAEIDAQAAKEREQAMAPFRSGEPAKVSETPLDWTGAFIRSAAEGTLNLFGVPKSASNIAWEETHPLSSTAASFLGIGGVYGGFFKATKSLSRVEKTLDSISGIANSPIRGGIAKEALRFTPLESARIIGTAIGEPERLDEQLFESGINIALSGGLGALGGIPAAFGRVDDTLKELAPNIDLNQPKTLQLRQLRADIESGKYPAEALPRLQRAESQLDKQVRFLAYGDPKSSRDDIFSQLKVRYVSNLDTPVGPQKVGSKTALINSLFVPGGNKIFSVQRLLSKADDAKYGVGTEAEVQEVLGRLPKNFTSHVTFPRLVTLRAKQGKESIYNLVQGKLASSAAPIGDGSYMLKEADQGLFIFLKKVKGDPAKFSTGDQFVSFMTDRPDLFGGRAAAWMDKQVEAGMWWARQFPQNQELLPGSIQALLREDIKNNPLKVLDDMLESKNPVGKLLGGMGLKPGEQTTAAVNQLASYAQEFMSPAAYQFIGTGPGKPLANWIFQKVRLGFETANARAEAMIYGLPKMEGGKNLFKQILIHGNKALYPSYDQTPYGYIQKLTDAERGMLRNIIFGRWKMSQVEEDWKAGTPGMGDTLYKLLRQLDELDQKQWAEMNHSRKTLGMPEIKRREGHFMFSHLWDGDVRLRIRNENGETVWMVGADSRGAAIKQADFIINDQGMKGKWKYDASRQWTDDLFMRGQKEGTDDVSSMLGVNVGGSDFARAAASMEKFVRQAYDPKALKTRHDVGGFSLDMSDKAIADRLFRHARALQTHIADISLRGELISQLDDLQRINPSMLRQIGERWNNFLGISGKFSQAQNAILDRSPVSALIGNNSASKIVGAINTADFNLRLGSFNFMYPTVNMFSFMTTVLPQVSFVATADPKTLTMFYQTLMAHGADGLAKRAVHMLDPLKMVYRGFKLLGKGDEELTQFVGRASNEGVLAPRQVEEHIGVSSQLRTRLSGILKENNGFVKFIQYLSEWMPQKSEQFSRLHAFSTGYATGKDLVGLEGEALYRFAKDFTTHTMFGYNMVDRAKIIQGPLGSFWGLYKNWQMHYLSWMLEYAGQAGKGNFAPLLWSQAGVATVGGLGGTSAYGIADAFSRIGTGESAFSQIYNAFSSNEDGSPDLQSDVAFYGLPAFLGVSLQASTSSIGSNPAKDAQMLFSFVQAERAQSIGRAVGGAIDTWQATGRNPFTDKLVRDQFLKAVAPRSMLRTAQVLEGDYIRSLNTGNPLIQGLSPMDRFVYGLGFNTPEVDRTYKVSDELFRSEEKRKVAVRYFARQVVEMQNAGAWEDLTELSKRIMLSGVGMDSVLRSAEHMKQRSLQDVADYRLKRTSPDHLRRFVESEEAEPESPQEPSDGQAEE